MIYTLLTTRPGTINISIALTIFYILISWPTINKIKGFIPFELGNVTLAISLT